MAMVKDRVGLSELNDNKNNLGKALIAEVVGTFILNFFGCISVMNLLDQSTPANLVLISLSFGLSVMAMVQVRLLWTITITLFVETVTHCCYVYRFVDSASTMEKSSVWNCHC